ncbi:hypothetical protein GCM10027059_44990 [Myceligenerans halotolerans]
MYGWHDRTLGIKVRTADGGDAWLRIASASADWADEPDWVGNAEAVGPQFAAIPKPHLLGSLDWADGVRIARADLMTYVPDQALATGLVLDHPVDLPDVWWQRLRAGLGSLSTIDTERVMADEESMWLRILALFGVEVDPSRVDWTVAHGDLHFANLTALTLTILDWEDWGWAPAGYDAATLACAAVLQPDVAATVRNVFADQLTGYTGGVAQLAAASKYLASVELGDDTEIAIPIRRHAENIIRKQLAS